MNKIKPFILAALLFIGFPVLASAGDRDHGYDRNDGNDNHRHYVNHRENNHDRGHSGSLFQVRINLNSRPSYYHRPNVIRYHDWYQPTYVLVSPPAYRTVVLNDEEFFTFTLPLKHGGYTEVVIKRRGDGFVGPQGEYYQDMPQTSLLTAMYVR